MAWLMLDTHSMLVHMLYVSVARSFFEGMKFWEFLGYQQKNFEILAWWVWHATKCHFTEYKTMKFLL